MKTIKRWLSDTPDVVSDSWSVAAGGSCGFGYVVMGTQFMFVKNGLLVDNVDPFWVFNTHFSLDEDVKTKSSKNNNGKSNSIPTISKIIINVSGKIIDLYRLSVSSCKVS